MQFLFAWRYFKAKKTTNAINIIAWVSIVAMIIGTTALVLVLSVFNGFEGLVKSLYSAFYPDIKITAASGKVIHLSKQQLEQLKGLNDIRNFSLVVEEKGILQTKSRQFGQEDEQRENQTLIFIKGVDNHYPNVTGVADNIVKGDINQGNFNLGTEDQPRLLIGGGLENSLGVNAGNPLDPLIIYLPRKTGEEALDPLNATSVDTIRLAGAFMIQQDFDNKYGITNIDFVKRALKMEADEFNAVEIAVKDPDNVDRVQRRIKEMFGPTYIVHNKYQQNQGLYSVMNMERWVIYGVLCLILVVAAFNMIGALTMLVLEKQKDISVLYALGSHKGFIQRIFISEGLLLALIGGGIGMLLALVIAVLQINFHLIPLTGGSFLIDYFPVKLKVTDFLLVGVTVFVIAFLAAWFPSRKAAIQEFSLRSE